MSNQTHSTIQNPPLRRHKRRYWYVCADCGARRRSAHPLAQYCDEACRKHAYRKRKREQAIVAALQAAELASIEAARRAEAARQADQARRIKERAELARIESEKAEALRITLEAMRVFDDCQCGHNRWHITYEKQGLIGPKKTIKACNKCLTTEVLDVVIVCPSCKASTGFISNEYGKMRCDVCKHEYRGLERGQLPRQFRLG